MPSFGPPTPLTEADLLDLLERNMEDHWIGGLLEDPSSRSLFVGTAAVLLRAQTSIDENLSIGAYILSAPGRAPATSTLRLFRAGGGAAGTIDVAVRIKDNRGALWRPSAAFAVGASGVDQTIDVPIVTDRVGHWLNSFEPLTYTLLDAPFDPNFVPIAGPDEASGGTSPVLEQHGDERARPRATDETDDQYRLRLRFLEDQVSPKAIAEAVLEILDQYPATQFLADLIALDGLRAVEEPFRDKAQTAQQGLAGTDPLFADDIVAFFDDPSGPYLRDYVDALAWFDVRLPWFAAIAETRLFFDDGFMDDPDFGYADAPPDASIVAPIVALANELDERRPYCVGGRIIFGGDLVLARQPHYFGGSDATSGTSAWALGGEDSPADRLVAVRQFDGDAAYLVSTTGQGGGAAVVAGDQIYSFGTALSTSPLSVTRVVLRAWIRRRDVATGTDGDFTFIIKPATAGAAQRLLALGSNRGTLPVMVDSTFDIYREIVLILEENPITAAPWAVADILTFDWGIANTAAVGPTEEVRVSELVLEFHVRYN